MTGPSIGWKLRQNARVISDFIGWKADHRRSWIHQLMKWRIRQSCKSSQFYFSFKSISPFNSPQTFYSKGLQPVLLSIFTVQGVINTKKSPIRTFYAGAGAMTAATFGTLSGILVPGLHKIKPKTPHLTILPFGGAGACFTAIYRL